MSAACARVTLSVARRQLSSYLGNPIGYLFMLVYVVATMGFLLFVREDAFFARNVADLALLHDFMPWALAVLLPVLGMGAWATEKEQGTDELLLTMPVSILDAVVGKFLAIAAFFTIALVINLLSAFAVLNWLGTPDVGLLLANFFGWWLFGLAFAAFSLIASMLVASQAVAFVIGVLFCGLLMAALTVLQIFDPFHRGIIPASGVILAVVLVISGLAIAVLRLASRRWRPGSGQRIAVQVITLILALGVAVNVGRLGQRSGVDMDVTADGLSSVSAEALTVLEPLQTPVELVVAVTADATMPESLQLRAKEVLDMALALSRARPDLINLRILRPQDRLDDAGAEAIEIHGLQPRVMMDRTVVGNEQLDAFLGASVRAAGESSAIPYFFPGLSVEYELVRAIRTVSEQAAPQDIPEVRLRVAISTDLPEAFASGREQVIDKLAQIAGRSNARVDAAMIEVGERVEGAVDGQWLQVDDLGLRARSVEAGALNDDEAVDESEQQSVEVLFAAHAQSGDVVRRVQWLGDEADAGATLDDLIVDVRSRATLSKPVLGILKTEVHMNGGFHPTQGQLPRWEIVNEWAQQYEIRDVRPEQFGSDDFPGVDVLVAPLPSSLSESALRQLYDYVHAGNPTLILLDPFPYDSMMQGRFVAPLEPPEEPPPQYREMRPDPKGDIARFVRGLGLEWDSGEVLWSRFNPSASLRFLGPHFMWMHADRGAIVADHPINSGVDSLMGIFTGILQTSIEHSQGLNITPLLRPTPDMDWGVHHYNDLLRRDPQPRLAEVGREIVLQPIRDRVNPMIAAEVRGRPKHIYREESAEVDAGTDEEPPVHVVVVADTDLASSVFFRFYRDVDGEVSASDTAILASLRNVVFLGNAIDVLMGDEAMTSLRGRRPTHRTLTRMDAVFEATQEVVDEVGRQAGERKEASLLAAQARYDEELAAIDRRTDLDAGQKRNLKATVQFAAQRRLDIARTEIESDEQRAIDAARREQRLALIADRRQVKMWGIGVPAALLSLLVLLVVGWRFSRELKDVPAARMRRSS